MKTNIKVLLILSLILLIISLGAYSYNRYQRYRLEKEGSDALNAMHRKPTILPLLNKESVNQIGDKTSEQSTNFATIIPTQTPTITPVPNPVIFINPKEGQHYQKGQIANIEIKINKNNIVKVDIGVASGPTRNDYSYLAASLTSAPYIFPLRINESNYYIDSQKRQLITAYAYDSSGNYQSATVRIFVDDPQHQVKFKTPLNGNNFKSNDVIKIEAELSNGFQPQKVEFYAGSFFSDKEAIKILTSPPYSFDFELIKFMSGITATQNLPLAVKAYYTNGNYVSDSITINVSP